MPGAIEKLEIVFIGENFNCVASKYCVSESFSVSFKLTPVEAATLD